MRHFTAILETEWNQTAAENASEKSNNDAEDPSWGSVCRLHEGITLPATVGAVGRSMTIIIVPSSIAASASCRRDDYVVVVNGSGGLLLDDYWLSWCCCLLWGCVLVSHHLHHHLLLERLLLHRHLLLHHLVRISLFLFRNRRHRCHHNHWLLHWHGPSDKRLGFHSFLFANFSII